MAKRKRHGAAFKAKVALAAVRGLKTSAELAAEHQVHPTAIAKWKRQLLEGAALLFEDKRSAGGSNADRESALYQQIGKLQMELEWLKKKSTASIEQRRQSVDSDHDRLSVRRQCELLGLSRSSYYGVPCGESAENLRLMRLLDEQYLKTPFYGSRRMLVWLREQGEKVNRKRVGRLLRLMGLEAIYPRPRTTCRGSEPRIYPYLLRDRAVTAADQVWSSDITYVPLRGGFFYLTAVMDWHSRLVLSWRLSNTLDVGFCLEALEAALGRGRPEIFNTDQGSQFTSLAYTGRLERAGIRISMDGKGRALDNAFVERLWRSVKYEDIYLRDYATIPELESGLTKYFRYYCERRPHQGLAYRTPRWVYRTERQGPE